MIYGFKGEYSFLNNYFEYPVFFDGFVFNNNEAAFQSAKLIDVSKRTKFLGMTPEEAKEEGRKINLRPDWEDVKLDYMYKICKQKFSNKRLAKQLLNTKDEQLVYDGDKFWGCVDGVGENHLGIILMRIRKEINMGYSFDIKHTTEQLIKWIQDFFENNGSGCNAIVGISGGKDSSVVAALCVKALGKDRVIGVLMPDGEQPDIDYSKMLVQHLGIKSIEVNIKNAVDGVIDSIVYATTPELDFDISKQTQINLPARIRMSTLYAVSQSLNGRVANTCNLSEDWVGYATRYGDAAGDFSPLAQLTSEEVVAIGEYLQLPVELTRKVPSDGLCGKTDEDNLGFTYHVLNTYIRTGVCDNNEVKNKIDTMHKKNLFKLELMPFFTPVIK